MQTEVPTPIPGGGRLDIHFSDDRARKGEKGPAFVFENKVESVLTRKQLFKYRQHNVKYLIAVTKYSLLHRVRRTQQELAGKIGVTRQTVNAIDLGNYSPSLDVAFRIATVFRVPLDQVFQHDGVRTASEKKKV